MKKVINIILVLIIFIGTSADVNAISFGEDDLDILWLNESYDRVRPFSEGLAYVEKDGRCGYIDRQGNIVIPLIYEAQPGGVFTVVSFHEALVAVKKDNMWGYIDRSGNEVIPCQYYNVREFSQGLAAVQNDYDSWTYIDRAGNQVFSSDMAWEWTSPFHYGKAVVSTSRDGIKKAYIIDKNAQETPFPEYLYSGQSWSVGRISTDEVIMFSIDDDYGLLDKEFNELIPPAYDDIYVGFSDHTARVELDGKKGILDFEAKQVIPAEYDGLDNFREGFALAGKDGMWGYIDADNQVAIPFVYDDAYSFSEGIALILKDGRWGILKNPLIKQARGVYTSGLRLEARASEEIVSFNGQKIDGLEIYNIDGDNYYKLRDVAKLFENTDARFSVDWDNARKTVSIKKEEAYTANNLELQGSNSRDKTAFISYARTEIDDRQVILDSYFINGQHYYKIEDLANLLGFNEYWNPDTGTMEITTD